MSVRRVGWGESLLVGIFVFGLLGTGGMLLGIEALTLLIREETVGLKEFELPVVACAAAAASIVGVLSWRFVVATRESKPRRGIWAGVLVGLLGHPLCWFLATLVPILRDPSLRGQSLGDTAFNLVFMTLLMSFSSLGLVGWISIPLAATLGYWTRRIERSWTVGRESQGPESGDAAVGA